jgi:DNA-binding NtrC family response regulator
MHILHYNDEEKQLHRYLKERGQANRILPADGDVFGLVRDRTFDAAFVGLHPHGLQLIRGLHRRNPDCLVTIITSDRNTRMAVEAMKLGAFDYLLSPLDFTEVERTVLMMMREHESQRERHSLEGQLSDAQRENGGPRSRRLGGAGRAPPPPTARNHSPRLADALAQAEAAAIRHALGETGNLSEAARLLAISRTTLYAKMRAYKISAPAAPSHSGDG